MTKIKFDVTASDPDKAVRVFESPRPGMYVAKINSIEPKDGRNDSGEPDEDFPMLEVVFEITGADKKKNEQYVGARLWWYPLLPDHPSFGQVPWKLDQLLLATGVATKKKRKGSFDPDELIDTEVAINVRAGKNADKTEYRGDVGAVLPYDEETFGQADDEDEDEEIVDDDDLEETEDDDEIVDEDEDEDAEEDDEEEGAYDDMNLAALRKEMRSRDLDPKGLDKEEMIDLLEEDDGLENEDGDSDEDEGDEDEPDEDEEEEEEEEEPAPKRRKPAARKPAARKKPTARKKATARKPAKRGTAKKTTAKRSTAKRSGGKRGRGGEFPFDS